MWGNKETQVSENPEIHGGSDFTFTTWNMFFKKIHINQYNLCFICFLPNQFLFFFYFQPSFHIFFSHVSDVAAWMAIHLFQTKSIGDIAQRTKPTDLSFRVTHYLWKTQKMCLKSEPMWKYLKGVFSLTVFYWFKVINLFNYVPI